MHKYTYSWFSNHQQNTQYLYQTLTNTHTYTLTKAIFSGSRSIWIWWFWRTFHGYLSVECIHSAQVLALCKIVRYLCVSIVMEFETKNRRPQQENIIRCGARSSNPHKSPSCSASARCGCLWMWSVELLFNSSTNHDKCTERRPIAYITQLCRWFDENSDKSCTWGCNGRASDLLFKFKWHCEKPSWVPKYCRERLSIWWIEIGFGLVEQWRSNMSYRAVQSFEQTNYWITWSLVCNLLYTLISHFELLYLIYKSNFRIS